MAISQPTKLLTRLLWVLLIALIGGISFFGWTSDLAPPAHSGTSQSQIEKKVDLFTEMEDPDLFVRGPSPVSYDKTTPPGIGCEAIVAKSQALLIEAYTKYFQGIRYVNMWGYLGKQAPRRVDLGSDHTFTETGNKGDAAIWNAQQIMLATLGITSMETCR
jgi:hypothetical protein